MPRDYTTVFGGGGSNGGLVGGGNQQYNRFTSWGCTQFHQLFKKWRNRGLVGRDQTTLEGRIEGQMFAKQHRIFKGVKRNGMLLPNLGRGQGIGEVGNHAGEAAIMNHAHHLGIAAHFNHTRGLFGGHNCRAQNIAFIPHRAPF